MDKKKRSKKWDEHFLSLAETYSTLATCVRAQVGCIIAVGNLQLSEGYNGSISGEPHCTEEGCLKNKEGRCIRCIHAEQNAIINANRKGINIEGATAYVTHEPCETCTKLLRQSGIVRVVYRKAYPNEYNEHFIGSMEWEHMPLEEIVRVEE